MSFNRCYEVTKKLREGGFFHGYVCGKVKLFSEETIYVCQETNNIIWFASESEIIKVHNAEEICLHSQGFTFYVLSWHCNNGCGYTLNFNPTTFPNGISYME